MRNDLVTMVKDGVEIRVLPDHVKSKESSGWQVKGESKAKPKLKPETSEAE